MTGAYLLSVAALQSRSTKEISSQSIIPWNVNSLVGWLVSWLRFEPSTSQSCVIWSLSNNSNQKGLNRCKAMSGQQVVWFSNQFLFLLFFLNSCFFHMTQVVSIGITPAVWLLSTRFPFGLLESASDFNSDWSLDVSEPCRARTGLYTIPYDTIPNTIYIAPLCR